MSGMNATGLGRAISRRKALSLAAAAALGATLAPGTFRLRDSPVAGVPGPAELPTGFDFLDSPEFGIRVAIPADLVPVHPEVLLNEYGAMEAFREMAERSQVTLEEWLDDQFTNVDVLAIADDGAEAICLGCAGMGPLDRLVAELQTSQPGVEVHAIGDAVAARWVDKAIADGHRVGRLL